MERQTPENREQAPGALGVVQDLMNSGHLGARVAMSDEVAAGIRLRHAAGASQASLADAFGYSQKLISAVTRGVRIGDELGTAKDARRWLAENHLIEDDVPFSEADRQRLVDLRELLRALGGVNNGQPLDPGLLTSLNDVAARSPLVLRFDGMPSAHLQSLAAGVDGAIARLLATVFEAMRDGTFARLKRCPGDGCPHTFYDGSRNRTGTWCAMSVCGNRRKVQSYQERRRVTRGAGKATS